LFINSLNWTPLVIWFVTESNYLQFLELYLEFSQQKNQLINTNLQSESPSKKQNPLIPKEDFIKVTNKMLDLSKKKHHLSMTIDDIVSQTKDINLILDKMDENKHKHLEEEIKKIEVFIFIRNFFLFFFYQETYKNEEFVEKTFNIKQKNMLRVKTDRIIKFTMNFDLEILKNQRLLYTYPTGDIESVQIIPKASKKINIDFKNVNFFNNKKFLERNFNFFINFF